MAKRKVLDLINIDSSQDKSTLHEIKKIEANRSLVRINVINGYVMTNNPEKWENYEPFEMFD